MKISFFSNYFNAHQLELALELNSINNTEYKFISLLDNQSRIGRECLDYKYSFVLRAYENELASSNAMKHAIEDDLVVFGDMGGHEEYVRARLETGSLSFRYAERLLKRGDWWRFVPLKQWRTYDRFNRYKKKNMYILCASAYTARDLAMFSFPKEKCLKWGYFPQIHSESHITNRVNSQNDKITILSAQRLIPFKHVDLQIKLASKLKSKGYRFVLKIAGDGPERKKLIHLVEKSDLADCVEFLGALDPVTLQSLMHVSDVFLATSDRREGWGATINEAMAAECCVIASSAMGASPYLIDDGIDGVLFRLGDMEELYAKTCSLLDEPHVMRAMSQLACRKVRNEWGARVAANRLISFTDSLKNGELLSFESGPMSPA